jgi:hypothetical protein
MNNRITLKNVKIAQFASEETLCFEATVYFDGQRVATAHNDGKGGCTYFRPVARASYEAAEAYAKSLPAIDYGDFNVPSDLEHVVDTLVSDWDATKALTRDLKRACVYAHGGKLWLSTAADKSATHTERYYGAIRAKYPGAVILNTLPVNDALAIYKRNGK